MDFTGTNREVDPAKNLLIGDRGAQVGDLKQDRGLRHNEVRRWASSGLG